jgi:hypothetical protein
MVSDHGQELDGPSLIYVRQKSIRLFADMVPICLWQTSEKDGYRIQRVMRFCPLNMFCKPQHFEHRRRFIPSREDQR